MMRETTQQVSYLEGDSQPKLRPPTCVNEFQSCTAPAVIQKSEKVAKAFELRVRGLSYRRIATVLGCTPSYAHRLVGDGLAAIIREPAEMVRKLELLRLDALLAVIYPKAMAGDSLAIDRLLRISDHRLKLEGIAAPAKAAQVQPGISPIEGQAVDGRSFSRNCCGYVRREGKPMHALASNPHLPPERLKLAEKLARSRPERCRSDTTWPIGA